MVGHFAPVNNSGIQLNTKPCPKDRKINHFNFQSFQTFHNVDTN